MLAVPQPVKNIQMQVQVNTEVLVKFSAYHDGQQGRNGKTGLNLWLIAECMHCAPVNYLHHPWSVYGHSNKTPCSLFQDLRWWKGRKEPGVGARGNWGRGMGDRGEPVVVLFKSPFWYTSCWYTLRLIRLRHMPIKRNAICSNSLCCYPKENFSFVSQ